MAPSHQFTCFQGRTTFCTWARLFRRPALSSQMHEFVPLNPFRSHRFLSLSGTSQARKWVFSGLPRWLDTALGRFCRGLGRRKGKGTVINPTAAPSQTYVLIYRRMSGQPSSAYSVAGTQRRLTADLQRQCNTSQPRPVGEASGAEKVCVWGGGGGRGGAEGQ